MSSMSWNLLIASDGPQMEIVFKTLQQSPLDL